jgi:hypothetical protein
MCHRLFRDIQAILPLVQVEIFLRKSPCVDMPQKWGCTPSHHEFEDVEKCVEKYEDFRKHKRIDIP